jgi:O-antigen ligase
MGVSRAQSPPALTVGQSAAIVALIGIVVFRVHELLPASWLFFRPALLSGGLGLVLLIGAARTADRAALFRQKLARLIAAYMIWAVVTVPFAIWKAGALDRVYGFVPLVSVVAAFALIRPSMRAFDAVSSVLIACAVVLCVGALVQGQTMSGRLTATYSFDPNSLAAMMALAAPFAIMKAVRGKALLRVVSAALIVLMLLVVAKTQSRGSAIGLVAGLCVLPMAFKGRTRAVAIFGGLGVIAAFWILSPTEFRERMGSVTSEKGDYNTTEHGGRIQIWTRGLGYVAANPLVGVGIGNFEAAEGEYNRENGLQGKWSAPHNAVVEAFAELGLPGGFLFLMIFYSSIVISARKFRGPHRVARPELLASLVATAVCGLFLGLAYFWGTFALWGFSLLLGRISDSGVNGAQPIRVRNTG